MQHLYEGSTTFCSFRVTSVCVHSAVKTTTRVMLERRIFDDFCFQIFITHRPIVHVKSNTVFKLRRKLRAPAVREIGPIDNIDSAINVSGMQFSIKLLMLQYTLLLCI